MQDDWPLLNGSKSLYQHCPVKAAASIDFTTYDQGVAQDGDCWRLLSGQMMHESVNTVNETINKIARNIVVLRVVASRHFGRQHHMIENAFNERHGLSCESSMQVERTLGSNQGTQLFCAS